MKISKTAFLENLRCSRYAALDDLSNSREDSFITINGIAYNSEIYNDYLMDYLNKLDMTLEEVDNSFVAMLLPYFNEIELLVGNLMAKKFKASVVSAVKTKEQTLLEDEYHDAKIFSYIDVFQHLDNSYNICEVKGKTTNSIWKLGKSSKSDFGVDYNSIFKKCDDGIIRLREDINAITADGLTSKEYAKHRAKLFDINHEFGRIVYDLSFQRFIYERLYNESCNFYVGLLNNEYVFDGHYLDDKPLYQVDENGNEIVCIIDLTSITALMQETIADKLKLVVDRLTNANIKKVPLGKHCMRKKSRQCRFYDYCFDFVPKEQSVFNFIGSHNNFKKDKDEVWSNYDLVNHGIVNLVDVDDSLIHRPNNIIQKKCVLNDEVYTDKRKIISAIKSLNYPLYHLDFESLALPLPRFANEKCYTQSVFQFSIHVESAPGVCNKDLDHYEFLASDFSDQRQLLVEKMVEIIKPDNGNVIVYNQAFEKTRLREMAKYFPQYKVQLDDINERVFDLMYVLRGNAKMFEELGFEENLSLFNYYHKALNGSFSIKKVLPIFSNLTYDDMEVANGNDAMLTYLGYNKFLPAELDYKQRVLIEYCKQDTWAMVVILNSLRAI